MEEILEDAMAEDQAQKYINDAQELVSKASGFLDCAVQLGGTETLNSETISELESSLDNISHSLGKDLFIEAVAKKLQALGFNRKSDFRMDRDKGRITFIDLTSLDALCNLVEYGIGEYVGEREGTTRIVRKGTSGDNASRHTKETLRAQYLKEGRRHGA